MSTKPDQYRVERILESLTGMQKTPAPDYFYTRLKARLETELNQKTSKFPLLRPVLLTCSLFVILIINIISLSQLKDQSKKSSSKKENMIGNSEAFSMAYNLENISVY